MLKDPNDHDCRSRDSRYESKNYEQQMLGYKSKNNVQQIGQRNVVQVVFHVSFLPVLIPKDLSGQPSTDTVKSLDVIL
jgi:hypothetical protein